MGGIAGQFSSDDPVEERMRPFDWRDKYRWPDPDWGWEGPLAGYPPGHPARGGRPCPLGVMYPGDPGYAPPPGYEGKPYNSAKFPTKIAVTPVTPVVDVAVTPVDDDGEEALSNAERQRRWKVANREKVNAQKRAARERKKEEQV